MTRGIDYLVTDFSTSNDGSKRRPRRRQRGALVILEILVSVAIIAAMGGIIAWVCAQAFSRSDASIATSNAQTLLASARQFRGPGGYGYSSLLPSLDVQGGLPASMSYTASTDTLKNTWNGIVNLVGRGAGYQLIESNVPKDACIVMAQNVNLDQNIGLQVNTLTGTTGITKGAMTRAEATSNCNKDYNTLKWETNVSRGQTATSAK